MNQEQAWDLLSKDREELAKRDLLFKEKGVLSDFAMRLAKQREAEREERARQEALSFAAFIFSG